jgi:phosphoribosylanthranilate isomerase
MTAIKICGITREADATLAVRLGANAIGFVLFAKSPRRAELKTVKMITAALPPFVTPVGVFVDPSADDIARAAQAGVRLAQVHGRVPVSSPLPVLRAVHLGDNPGGLDAEVGPLETILLDAHDPVLHGGTGRTVDFARAASVAAKHRIILAGGLTPSNVRDAIAAVRPYAVDVASGVEAEPGVKDPVKLRAFIEAVKATEGTEGTDD